jgi:hypothetical protein
MHISQIQSFTHQPLLHVIQNHPLYSGIPLTYPFIINYISAILQKTGLPITHSLIIPSILLSQILILNLYIFSKTILNSSKQAILAITIFFAGGGLGFIHYFNDLVTTFSWDTVFYPPQEYTHMKDI